VNGVHDMGGLQNFGPVRPEAAEPSFHHPWERRVFALTLAMGATGRWNLDQSRAARESLPPAQYLASSYYRIWLDGLIKLLQERDLVSAAEVADGRVRVAPPGRTVLTTEHVADAARGFDGATGGRPRARHRRCGAHTAAESSHAHAPAAIAAASRASSPKSTACVFPDANACGHGEAPQWLYTVRFEARDLWGRTRRPRPCVDCWGRIWRHADVAALTRHDPTTVARAWPALRAALPDLPRDAGGPVFGAPWEPGVCGDAWLRARRVQLAGMGADAGAVISELRARRPDTGEDTIGIG
jgi:nitrile hydratase